MVLPAVAMAVSLGVTLPSPARAQTTLPSGTSTVYLAGYSGATSFVVPLANTVNVVSGKAIYGDNSHQWTLTNQGTIKATDGSSAGILLAAGGSIANNGGYISGAIGVQFGGSSGATLINTGTIIGTSGTALQFGSGNDLLQIGTGAVFTGAVDGGGNGVAGDTLEFLAGSTGTAPSFTNFENLTIDTGASWTFNGNVTIASGQTLINHGTATANLYDAGLITNTGVINQSVHLTGYGSLYNSGFIASVVDPPAGVVSLTNAGTIGDIANVHAVYINADAVITNTNSGLITAQYAFRSNGSFSMSNAGSIVGSNVGVEVFGNGTIDNNAGYIGGAGAGGIYGSGRATITNTGTIRGGDFGVDLAPSSLASTITDYGVIGGTIGAVRFGSGDDVLNIGAGASFTGLVDGGAGYDLVEFHSGADVSLGAINVENAVVDSGATWTNIGNFTGTVTLLGSANLHNSDSITYVLGAFGSNPTITNDGSITGGTSGIGLYLSSGGTVTNNAGIHGDIFGVQAHGTTATIANYGTISSSGAAGLNFGVFLSAGGSIYNKGLIEGAIGLVSYGGSTITNRGAITGATGIAFSGFAPNTDPNTVINYGAIIGTYGTPSVAIQFSGGDDLLQIGDGASFTGTVDGGAGANRIEFLGSGTLGGYGTFTNFQGVTIGGTQTWTFNGYQTFQENLTVAGTLHNDGGLYVKGVTLTNDGSLFNNGGSFDGVIGLYSGTLVNNGYLKNTGSIFNEGTSAYPGIITNASNGTFINDGFIEICDCSTFTNAGSLQNTVNGYIINLYGTAVVASGIAGTVTNFGLIGAGNAGIYGASGTSVTIQNYGIIQAVAPGSIGIDLQGDGIVTNSGSFPSFFGGLATIYGYLSGVRIAGNGTVTNAGYIFSSTSPAVYLGSGTITNGDSSHTDARIASHYSDGVRLGSGTVLNYGTIGSYGSSANGVFLEGAGTITNRGGIYGATGISAYSASATDIATILNHGTIGGVTGPGVYIAGNNIRGVIVNYADGVIYGNLGVQARHTSLTNYGAITGTGLTGVMLEGVLDNRASGVIHGGQRGVYINYSGSSVSNSGLIQGGTGPGIEVSGTGYLSTTVTNTGSIIGGGGVAVAFARGDDVMQIGAGSSITGSVEGGSGHDTLEFIAGANSSFANYTGFEALSVDSGATWTNTGVLVISTLTNAGSLINAGAINTIVTLTGAGVLTNQAGATMDGAFFAVYGHNSTGAGVSISNAGALSGSYAGVFLADGGKVTNSGTAANIYGGVLGVYSVNPATVTNEGIIQGGFTGVKLAGGGTVTNTGLINGAGSYANGIASGGPLVLVNNAGGTIQGGNGAIYLAGGDNSITNDGLIKGTGSDGILLAGSGNIVTNTGTISGNVGVRFLYYGGLGSTLTNGGTIIGTSGYAVEMGHSDDVLRVLPGAVFEGKVDGGGGSDTLAFIGSGGTLNGTAAFTRFGSVQFDANSSWTFAGSQSFGFGVALSNAGTLTNAGSLDVSASLYRALTNSGTFINQGTFTGAILDSGLVRNSGTLNSEVVLYTGAVLDNLAGGTIAGGTSPAVYGYRSGILITNAGTMSAASAGEGVRIAHGGSFTNSGTASLVSGLTYGIGAHNDAAFITNQGTITGVSRGVYLSAGGTFTNSGTASLASGAFAGVAAVSYGSQAVVTNQGTITSTNGPGVSLRGDGTVSNSGNITGSTGVIIVSGTSVTLINDGTISSTYSGYLPVAVQFLGNGDSTLVVSPGAEFNGAVIAAGGGHNSLVFAGSGGTLTGNMSFSGFPSATIANGASWTFAGTGTFNYGVTLSNAGLLTNTGTLHFPGTRDPFFNSGTFQNNGDFEGTIADYGLVRNSGSINGGIGLLAGGTLDNQAGGVITTLNPYAVVGRAAGVSLNNAGTIAGGPIGVYFDGSAAVSNSGLITGSTIAIYFTHNGTGTISNSGTLTGIYGQAILLKAGGTVTNQGLILASGQNGEAIYLAGAGSITNSGTLSAPDFGKGIELGGVGHVANSGLISGGQYGVFAYAPGSVISNSGTIAGTGAYGSGMAAGAGSISNTGASALISGSRYGILSFGGGASATTIANQGTISGGSGAGILLRGDGVVTNSAGATITGFYQGIDAYGGIVTVTNSGTVIVTGTQGPAIELNRGAVINSGTASLIQGGVEVGRYSVVTNQGTIIGAANRSAVTASYGSTLTNSGMILTGAASSSGIYLYGSGLITNSGTIRATSDRGSGIYLYGYGSIGVANNTGLIRTSGAYGVGIYAFGGSISNSGTIQADGNYGAGIRIQDDASVANAGTVLATGTYGIGIHVGSASVANTGLIQASGSRGVGIYVYGGGIISNAASGRIAGGYAGILTYGARTSITNQGTISGQTGVGLAGSGDVLANNGAASLITGTSSGVLAYGGKANITNQGTISGVTGVWFGDTAGDTLTNSGTIIGTGGTAVRFGSGDDLLIIQPGAVFTGLVDGKGGVNTLEFAGGTEIPDFTQFLHFGQADLDAGTTWTFNSAQSFPAGLTLVNAGTLINNSTLTNNGLITNNGLFTNTGSVIGGGTIGNTGSLGNSGLISGGNYGVVGGGTISNSGTIIGVNTGVSLTNGSLNNTGLIQGGAYGVQLGAGATLSNSGIIQDDAIAGASLGTNSSLTNNAGSTLSGVTGMVFTGTGASLTNNGTITGSGGIAIQFGAGVNTVTLGTTSVLNGAINGGGGAGRIVLNGTGTLANTMTNFGAGSSLTISGGASWKAGNWAIANVVNNGTLSLGATPATVTLTGNFTQSSTGVLNTILDNGGGSSRIQVSGTAALDGALNIVMPTIVGAPIKYTLVSATGGVSGAFASFNADAVLLSSVLSYDANDAYVTVAQRKLSEPIGVTETPNQLAVANAFDIGLLADPAGFGATLGAFNTLNAAGFTTTLNQMSGEQIADVSTTALLAGRQFLGQIQQHSRFSAQAPGTWTLWGQGFGQSGDLDGDGSSHGLNQGLSGVMAGADVGISQSLRLGGVVGFADGHFNVAGGLGGGRMDYTQIALTGSYGTGALYVDGAFGGIFGTGSSRRDVAVGAVVNHATAHLDTTQAIGALEIGYRVPLGETISLTPFARLQAGSVGRDAISESGAGILNLAAPQQDSAVTQGILGARFGTGLPLGELMVAMDASLGWSHELGDAARMARLSFAGTPGTGFVIAGAGLSRDAADIGLGLSIPVFGHGQASLHYDGIYGSNGTSHAVSLGLRFGW